MNAVPFGFRRPPLVGRIRYLCPKFASAVWDANLELLSYGPET